MKVEELIDRLIEYEVEDESEIYISCLDKQSGEIITRLLTHVYIDGDNDIILDAVDGG